MIKNCVGLHSHLIGHIRDIDIHNFLTPILGFGIVLGNGACKQNDLKSRHYDK